MCPPGHHHNGCMATRALGHAYVRLHIVDTKEPKSAKSATSKARSII